MKITILGSGASGGVPLVGGIWGACDPNEPKNRRRRASILVEIEPSDPEGSGEAATILVDTAPDLREQLLMTGTRRIDALLWTHAHADHMNGIDDVRMINRFMQAAIPAYGPPETIEHAHRAFGYALAPLPEGVTFYFKPCLDGRPIPPGPFTAAGVKITAVDQDHGFSRTYGYRFGRMAYSTDVVQMPPEVLAHYADLDLWIIDAFRPTPHTTHSHLARTLEWIATVKPKRAILTHMNEDMDYATLKATLPEGVEPGFDGMVVAV